MRHAENARFYGANRVPFVMGTTGGDREQLLADTLASGTYAVIAPQMGKQVRRNWTTLISHLNPDLARSSWP